MPGQVKYAHRLANHLEAPIDAACMIELDATAGRAPTGWLAVGPDRFALVEGDAWRGRPRGRAIATIRYAAIADIELTAGGETTRADVELRDGRTVAFAVRRRTADAQALEVLELLMRRCGERDRRDAA